MTRARFLDELLTLDNQICFRLYAASRLVTRVYRPHLEALGLTYPQYLVLLALWQWDRERDREPVTISRLSRRLWLDAGTLTPLLRRMETAGLITRTRANQDDGREVHIALTRVGRGLKRRAAKIPEALLRTPGVPIGELPALKSIVDRLIDAIPSA